MDGEYIVVEQWETERLLNYNNVTVHLSWGSPEVRLYKRGTTPWVWEAVAAARTSSPEVTP